MNYYYEYFTNTNGNKDDTSGFGLYKCGEDNDKNLIQTWYVTVKDSVNHTFSKITSDTVTFQMEKVVNQAKPISFQALRSNGNIETGVHAEHWMYVVNLWNTSFPGYLTINHKETLRSSPFFLTTNNDKFNYWKNSNETYVLNYKDFLYTDIYPANLIANYKTSYGGVTIQSYIDNFSGYFIEFKDPWLVDYNESPYGIRNQGMSAPFKELTSPFNLSLNSDYNGVFLDQDYNTPGQPYYYIGIPSNITISGKSHKLYLQSWDTSGAKVKFANADSTPVVFLSNNASVTANVKATQLSSNNNTYLKNGQSKIVRTPDLQNTLHMVYESMGHVWYETSTDNGQTWDLMNNGHPIDNGGGKNPSIDFVYFNSTGLAGTIFVVIVYQEPGYLNYSNLKALVYKGFDDLNGFTNIQTATVYSSNDFYSSYDEDPVIAIDSYGYTRIVWQDIYHGQLYIQSGGFSSGGLQLTGTAQAISGTSTYSKHPAIAASKVVGGTEIGQLAWEENNAIKYVALSGITPYGSIETPSSGNGYNINKNPSLAFYSDNITPVLAWKVFDNSSYTYKAQLRIKYEGTNWSPFWTFSYIAGNDINSVNINSNIDNKFVLAWGGRQDNNQYITSVGGPNNVYSLSTYGDIQISNAGSTMGDMKISSFDRYSTPYSFTESAVTQGLSKITRDSSIVVSRGICLTTQKGTYKFDMGDIKLNGHPVLFSNSNFDSTSQKMSNNTIESLPFNLSDMSDFRFTVNYQPVSGNNSPVNNDKIKFNIKLVDASTGKVLGNLVNQSLDKTSKENIYSVNPKGIGSGGVKLVLRVNLDKGESYTIENSVVTKQNSVKKVDVKQITFNGKAPVNDYGLAQNYPNPFNPTTVINYQIPKDGMVTINVYDILGNVVKTLVNEYKQSGRYNVTFNGSNLSSGVYLYTIKSNNFTATKKLLLLK